MPYAEGTSGSAPCHRTASAGQQASGHLLGETVLMNGVVAVILAAGKGTRMKSSLPKALHPMCGKPMTRYVIDACKEAGIEECLVVVGHGADQVQEGLGSDVTYVLQKEQLGTGHACRLAVDAIASRECDVLVLPGDAPLITARTIRDLVAEHTRTEAAATLLTTILDDAGHYGRVIRSPDGSVLRIVEAKDATPEELSIREMNAGMYVFQVGALREYLRSISKDNVQGEYYLTDVIGLMASDGLKVGALISEDKDVVLAINNRVELAELTRILQRRINQRLMLDGVTMIDPENTYVDWDVLIGPDTVIYPGTVIEKGSRIGSSCVIGPSSKLVSVEIADRVTILLSHVVESAIGEGTRVGPYANIRPGCRIGRNVRIGDFVEAKNALIGNEVSIAHLAYVGDAEIGDNANIGAGTITCNYDGRQKHRTIIGRNAFVGSNVTLIAPVEIGQGAYVAAGSTITKNVPPDALGIGRARQENKEGWARRRRERSN